MKVLFVAPLWSGSTCLHRLEAMKELGNDIEPVDTLSNSLRKQQEKFIYRLIRRIFGPLDYSSANQKILHLVKKDHFDILWIEKGLTIKATTLHAVRQAQPKIIIAGYSPDDMAASHNQTAHFLQGLPLYSIYFTTKSYNVRELQALGCSRVFFIQKSYDPRLHYPRQLTTDQQKQFGAPVGFVGDYERDRAELMLYLAQNGITVRVWGPNWDKCPFAHPNLKIEKQALWGESYALAICAMSINLGFLRKINRDLQTCRSIEIPACGQFMLAERTDEHLGLFLEGQEAEFFSNKEEMLKKVRYYLSHENERLRIAHAGRERCLKSGYSNHERIKTMFDVVSELKRNLQSNV